MGLFDQSPFELMTGKKSPVETTFPNFSKFLGENLGFATMVGGMAGPVEGGASVLSKMFGTGAKVTKAAVPGAAVASKVPWGTVATAGGGALAGIGLSSIFGGAKKQEQQQSFAPQQPIQNTNTYTYSPQITKTNQITNAQSYMIQSNSPNASMKKSDTIGGQAGPVAPTLTPQISVIPAQTTSQKGDQGQGTDWGTIAAIAGVALVAYGMVTGGKHGK